MHIYSLSRELLSQLLRERNIPEVHSKELYRRIYRIHDHPSTTWEGSGLPLKLEALRKELDTDLPLTIREAHESAYDQSVKFLLEARDGKQIEAVLMPEKNRVTLCVSSQVGCAQACAFCHTGRMGLSRQLAPEEIVGQIMIANQWIATHPGWDSPVTNVVFMGMGEPLDNVDSVVRAVQILKDPLGLGIAPRKITVSTAGHLEGLRAFHAREPSVSLALSLHEADPKLRARLMPITRRYPLAEVLQFFKEYSEGTKRDVLIQYTVLAGVNDTPTHAKNVAECLKGLKAKINLIPFNPVSVSSFVSPQAEGLEGFRQLLTELGLVTMVRYSKGQDISAACGQLVTL